jgi:hypothetical protein
MNRRLGDIFRAICTMTRVKTPVKHKGFDLRQRQQGEDQGVAAGGEAAGD